MSIWQGVALIVLPDPGGSVPTAFQDDVTGGFSSPVTGVVGVADLHRRRRRGCSARASACICAPSAATNTRPRMSGVRVENVKTIAYVLAGLLAALGGMYLATVTASGSPTVGDGYILTSIAAVVIGGVPLSGGRGTAVGVVMGALILTITGSLLYFADVSSFYQSLIDGVILLAVVGSGGTRDWLRSIAAVRA